jgi:uncharacterized protein YggT (Ycf19 family)
MTIDTFFNNLNPLFIPLLNNSISISFIHYSSILLINLISYAYVLAKFYKVLCFSKMTFDWLPMINPYVWPFSFFKLMTDPYFRLWEKILPSIKFEKRSVDISSIIALESLNTITFLLILLSNQLLIVLETTEKILIASI